MKLTLVTLAGLVIGAVVGYSRPEIYNARENAGIVFDFGSVARPNCVGLEVRGEPGFFAYDEC